MQQPLAAPIAICPDGRIPNSQHGRTSDPFDRRTYKSGTSYHTAPDQGFPMRWSLCTVTSVSAKLQQVARVTSDELNRFAIELRHKSIVCMYVSRFYGAQVL